ncbi:hypothetical protein [Candidatus Viridilinea mediisalina]|uniref:Uncharacterized protein n=1 Tax=Candidatus Viridilinea mediisalina TaxID=2024553 RepID=A0A2A6RE40_9CHLR|nr:hypothetical protein [Candidatus Viridilinea mediisalina]PDW00528.1 hypothetical protein CJ255_20630 [Candidatus Viridilinea mediisalina]
MVGTLVLITAAATDTLTVGASAYLPAGRPDQVIASYSEANAINFDNGRRILNLQSTMAHT